MAIVIGYDRSVGSLSVSPFASLAPRPLSNPSRYLYLAQFHAKKFLGDFRAILPEEPSAREYVQPGNDLRRRRQFERYCFDSVRSACAGSHD